MFKIGKIGFNLKNKFLSPLLYESPKQLVLGKTISTTSPALLKEISEVKEGKVLTIEAKIVPSPREPYFYHTHDSQACPLCRTNLDVKHTDVLILSQFVRSDGCMLPRRITGLCRLQQKRVSNMVSMAQKAGLMSNLTPPTSKKNPKLRDAWKKYNTYFDESTIKPPKQWKKNKV